MTTKYFYILTFISAIFLFSCSKKIHPTTTGTPNVSNNNIDTVTVVAKKTVIKRKIKEAVPKIISVNDAIAKKTVDGRLYYDLDGHRYWRNNKDGKYYLFNKAMYDQAEFKPN